MLNPYILQSFYIKFTYHALRKLKVKPKVTFCNISFSYAAFLYDFLKNIAI